MPRKKSELRPIGKVAKGAIMRKAAEYRKKGHSPRASLRRAWADAKKARRKYR